MQLSNARIGFLVAAGVLLAACGKQERLEAVNFAKVLSEHQPNLVAADAIEKEIVASARAWCGGIKGAGAGRGVELDQNAAVAGELAKSAVAASAQLGEIRQAIDTHPLKEDYARGVRNTLMTQLTRRQRMLQEVRAMLESSATQFRQYRQNKSFAGDTYPDGIATLDTLLGSYKPPEPAVGTALSALKSKYNFRENEI
jgi:hypothetical protein